MFSICRVKLILKTLTVEPFLFFIFFAFVAKQTTYTQFYQDKVCLADLRLSNPVCHFVSSTRDVKYEKEKAYILTKANQLNSYQSIIENIPGAIFAIMLAPWADKVKGARRKLMIWSAIGQILDSTLGIVSIIYEDTLPPWTALAISIPSSLMGGMLAVNISTFGYVSMTTPAMYMSLRFIFMDIVFKACHPLSTFLSGQLLSTPSWIPNKVRNFAGIYILCFLSGLSALVWSLTRIDNSDSKENIKGDSVEEIHIFFNRENILQLKNTLIRSRDNSGHIHLWLLLVIQLLSVFVAIGPSTVRLSFVQAVYGWNLTDLNNAAAIFTLVTLVIYSVGSPILTNKLKLSEPELAVFGLSGTYLYVTAFGTILNPWGFYISNIIGSFGSINGASIQTTMSKIVDEAEKSSAFALLALCANCSSVLANWFYPMVFRHTLSTLPGLGMQLATILLLVAIGGWIYIDFHTLNTKVSKALPEALDNVIIQTKL